MYVIVSYNLGMDSEVTSGSQKGKTPGTSSSKTTRRSWTRKEEDVLIHALKDIVLKDGRLITTPFGLAICKCLSENL